MFSQWVDAIPAVPDMSDSEMGKAIKKMTAFLVQGKKPVRYSPSGPRPHAIMVMGGDPLRVMAALRDKSKAALLCEGAPESYACLDVSVALQFHPQARSMWKIKDVQGRAVDAKNSSVWLQLEAEFSQLCVMVLVNLLERGYNVVVEMTDKSSVVWVDRHGYKTTLLYVTTPFELELKDSVARAERTGMFVGRTLKRHTDNHAHAMRAMAEEAPFTALLVDKVATVAGFPDETPSSAYVVWSNTQWLETRAKVEQVAAAHLRTKKRAEPNAAPQ